MTAGPIGHSLKLFFIDGRPDGMLTAEVFNWKGHVLMTPRMQVSEALKRKEARYTGVYLLIGEKEGEPLAYIGEGDNIGERIRNHDGSKDWWNTGVLITSAADSLNKAQARYLESRLIEEARAVRKIALENASTPPPPSLSEADQADMEAFLAYILMVLPALRIDSFLKNTRPASQVDHHAESVAEAPVFELQMPRQNIRAKAIVQNGELVVQAGSTARQKWVGQGSKSTTYGRLYAELVSMGVLVEQGSHRVFSESYGFKSPSAAASVVAGRPENGAFHWKVEGKTKTYKQWEAERLARENGEAGA